MAKYLYLFEFNTKWYTNVLICITTVLAATRSFKAAKLQQVQESLLETLYVTLCLEQHGIAYLI